MQLDAAREQMIEQQVRACDVSNEAVLSTLRALPREHYVPAAWVALAYADCDVSLAEGKHMLRPMLIGRILQALAVTGGESVLEIGTGSGYLSGCMARLGARVRSLEIHPTLAEFARTNLARDGLAAAGPGGVQIEVADGTQLAESDRYDAIVVTASIPTYLPCFEAALRPGGRLFVVVGQHEPQQALLVRRSASGGYSSAVLFETTIEPLEHATSPPRFVF